MYRVRRVVDKRTWADLDYRHVPSGCLGIFDYGVECDVELS